MAKKYEEPDSKSLQEFKDSIRRAYTQTNIESDSPLEKFFSYHIESIEKKVDTILSSVKKKELIRKIRAGEIDVDKVL